MLPKTLFTVLAVSHFAACTNSEPIPPTAEPKAAAQAPATSASASSVKPPAICTQSNALPQTGLRHASVTLNTRDGTKELNVEIAGTGGQRQIGMMCRTTSDDQSGMLFVFPQTRPQSFWMKNTLIPLDIIFIDESGRVINIRENTTPLSLKGETSLAPARYVLEVRGGFSKEYGLASGDIINLPKPSN